MHLYKVIVVDDNQTNRLLPGLILRRLGHEVQECDGASPALDWLQNNPCDIVLLDISMPSVSGLQLCQQLRQNEDWQHLKIIAYTAHAMPQEIQMLEAAGFDKILLKPIRSEELLAVIEA
jgi:CheY-like chemotaxis protein